MKNLTGWISEMKEKFSNTNNLGQSLEDINGLLKELNIYYHTSKPDRQSQLAELKRIFNNYESRYIIFNS